MRLIKLFLIFIITLLIFISNIGCNQSLQKANTAEEQDQDEQKENVNETQDHARQQEIDKFRKDFTEWENYLDEYFKNVSPLIEDLKDLGNKRREANKTNDIDKATSYMQVEEDKCEEVVNALYDLYVPMIAKDYHEYITNSYIKYKQWYGYMNRWARNLEENITGFDSTEAQSLMDESRYSMSQANQELERIIKNFNQKALELGLSKPYYD